jgi:hypothetical protein
VESIAIVIDLPFASNVVERVETRDEAREAPQQLMQPDW